MGTANFYNFEVDLTPLEQALVTQLNSTTFEVRASSDPKRFVPDVPPAVQCLLQVGNQGVDIIVSGSVRKDRRTSSVSVSVWARIEADAVLSQSGTLPRRVYLGQLTFNQPNLIKFRSAFTSKNRPIERTVLLSDPNSLELLLTDVGSAISFLITP